MDRTSYAEALRRRWWVPVVLGVVGAAIGLLVVPTTAPKAPPPPRWRSIALVGVVPTTSAATNGALTTSEIIYYAHESSVITAAAHAAGINLPLPKIEAAVKVSTPPNTSQQTGVVRMSAQAGSAAQAALFANAYATQLGDYLTQLAVTRHTHAVQKAQRVVALISSTIKADGGVGKVPALATQLKSDELNLQELNAVTPSANGFNVLQPAEADASHLVSKGTSSGHHPSHLTWGLVGLVIGVVLGAALVLLVDRLDRRIRSAARAADAFGYRVLAEIPADPPPASGVPPEAREDGLAEPNAPKFVHAESYRKLLMSVLLEGLEASPTGRGSSRLSPRAQVRQVVLVVSPSNEPSRSSVVDNLAAAYAEAGQRALVIDALGPYPAEQLLPTTTVAATRTESIDIEVFIKPSVLENVALISLREVISNSGELLTRVPSLLREARKLADAVIIEAPPLLAYHDGEALASLSDVVLLVGEWGGTLVQDARRAGDILRRFSAPVLGVVFVGRHEKPALSGQRDNSADRGPRKSQLQSELAAAGPVGSAPRAGFSDVRQP